ncbi:MAG: transglycosylase SLT domain-containing protein [Steroidobacteraceae bacterium]
MRTAARVICLLTAAALALPLGASARPAGAAAANETVRQAFEAAYAQAPEALPDAAAHDSASLKHYPLYPYLVAARLESALGAAPQALAPIDRRAAGFIAAHRNEPVSREVRKAWLQSLAQRSLWAPFLTTYRSSPSAKGPALQCDSFAARISLDETAGLAREVETAWLTPHSRPQCAQAFAWLASTGALTTALIDERARLALADSDPAFARQIIAKLPRSRAAPLLQWAALLERPKRGIDALIASPGKSVEPAALLAGWTRLARADSAAAKARYARLITARSLRPAQASPYALSLALSLAWDHDPDALGYFRRVQRHDLDDAALAWRARAALWSKHWSQVLHSISAMSPGKRQSARWRYWQARADKALQHPGKARQLYESLLTDDDYYAGLAAARLGRRVTPHPQPLPADPSALAALGEIPALVRARELFYCGMEARADTEWRFGYGSLSKHERLQAIRLAAGWGWYVEAVATATAQHVFNDYALLYPRPFDAEVSAAVERAGLRPAIVYGVIRQESLYRVDALSGAGARGLMQLLPGTARRTARRWKLPLPSAADLYEPAVNISLGAARLRMLLDRFGGQVPVALAGYNAGVNAATRWLPSGALDSDVWIENIPYHETREYVQRVLWQRLLYAWLASDRLPQSSASWLAPVNGALGRDAADFPRAHDRRAAGAPRT